MILKIILTDVCINLWKYIYIYFSFLLLTLNVPLRVGKCTPGVHVSQVGNPCIKPYKNTNVVQI